MFELEDMIKWEELAKSLQQRFIDLWNALNQEISDRKAGDLALTNARTSEDKKIWDAIEDLKNQINNIEDNVNVIETGSKNSKIQIATATLGGHTGYATIIKGTDNNNYLDLYFWSDPLLSGSSKELSYTINFPLSFSETPAVQFVRKPIGGYDVEGGALGWIDSVVYMTSISSSSFTIIFDSLHESGWEHDEQLIIHASGKYQ